MNELRQQSHSFILRVWWEEERMWRGRVQHAGTGQVAYVQSLEDLLAFIQRYAGELGPETASTAPIAREGTR